MPESKGGKSAWWRVIVLIVVVAGLVAAGKFLPLKEYLLSLLAWTQSLGFWGPVVVVLFYVVACLLFLPGSILTIGAGFLFKLALGTVTVSIGATLGACAAFWVGRTVARGWVAKKIGDNAKFAAIDEAVGREGFKIVLLTRLSPVFPFNLLNYAFGLTRVRFRSYALASWIGMLPGTVVYVYIGSAARSLADAAVGGGQKSPAQRILFWGGLVIAVAVGVLIVRIARRALRQAADGEPPGDKPAGAKEGKDGHG
jgi:uncharacterized membrane protein YdjX (TVP38/TMEM64 family)